MTEKRERQERKRRKGSRLTPTREQKAKSRGRVDKAINKARQKRKKSRNSRDAVESAISRAKENKEDTWEGIVSKSPKQFTKWESGEGLTREAFDSVLKRVSRPLEDQPDSEKSGT